MYTGEKANHAYIGIYVRRKALVFSLLEEKTEEKEENHNQQREYEKYLSTIDGKCRRKKNQTV
jgi:ADP-glucose pyrophosphorylase